MGHSFRLMGGFARASLLAIASLAIFISLVSHSDAASINNLGAAPPKVYKATGAKNVVAAPLPAKPASADGFWTKERMLSATPVVNDPSGSLDIPSLGSDATASAATGDFTPGNVTEYPQRIHGKIFFKVGESVHTCSGTVIESAKRNVVFTAGHCVFSHSTGAFVDNIAFVPGYENGEAPYGIFYGAEWLTTRQWVQAESNSYDIGVVVLEKPIQNQLGARQIAFDLNPQRREFTLFGYPARPQPRFDGEVLRGCHSRFVGRDGAESGNIPPFPIGVNPCFMQQGASGGGWVTLGNYVNSVVSYGYCDNVPESCGYIFGPYFSNAAKLLYTDSRVGGSPAPTVKLVHAPPRVVRKRRVGFRFGGNAATLLSFSCKLDRRRAVPCSSRISITRLSPGRHTLKVRAVDQTGKMSRRQIVRNFRVILPFRARR